MIGIYQSNREITMSLMVTPCGERMNVGRWVHHLPKCSVCALWWMKNQADKKASNK